MQQLTLEYILDKSTPLIFDEKNQQVNIGKHSFRIEVVTIILKMKVTIGKIERNEESIEIHGKIPFYSGKIEITKNEIKRILNLYNEYGSYKGVENVNGFDVEVTITKCY